MPPIIEALASRLPPWLLPSLVVAVAAIAVWTQNLQAQFGALDVRLATMDAEQKAQSRALASLETDLEANIAKARTDAQAALADVRESIATAQDALRADLRTKADINSREAVFRAIEQRIDFVEAKLADVVKHLEATDTRVEHLRDAQTVPGLR